MTRKIKIDDMLRIVEMCKIVENKGLDPFEIEVKKSLEKLREYLPSWKLLDELLIDAEAINQLSSIIKLQSDWIKHHSSLSYIDPLMIELKIRVLEIKDLVLALLNSWYPIVTIEQISSSRLKKSIDYWNALLPLNKRSDENFTYDAMPIDILNVKDLKKLKIISLENFTKKLENMVDDLRIKFKGIDQIEYWDYVFGETFDETLERIYLTSFLVTENYATIRVDPIEENIYLIPISDFERVKMQKMPNSVVIAVNYDSWKRLGERKRIDRRRN